MKEVRTNGEANRQSVVEGGGDVDVECTQDTTMPVSFSGTTTSTCSVAPKAPSEPLAWLKPLCSGTTNTTPNIRIIPLCPGTTSLGRDSLVSDIPLKFHSISRKHAIIEVIWPCAFIIQDGKSKNGTFVNGKHLGRGGRQGLQHGDKLTLGDVNFFFSTINPTPSGDEKQQQQQIKPNASATTHQLKSAAPTVHEDAAIDVILETVDDPIAEVSPPATAKMPVSDIKTSSNRKRKLIMEQAPPCSLPLPVDSREVGNEDEMAAIATCPTGQESNQKKRNVYSMLFRQPRRSSVLFEEQANSTEEGNDSNGHNRSSNCLVQETMDEAMVGLSPENDKDEVDEEDEDDVDPPFALVQSKPKEFKFKSKNEKQGSSVNEPDCKAGLDTTNDNERKSSFNYMVDDTILVSESEEKASDSTEKPCPPIDPFAPQTFAITKHLLNDGDLCPGETSDNHLVISETCEQDFQYSPPGKVVEPVKGDSSGVAVRSEKSMNEDDDDDEDEDDYNVLQHYQKKPICHSSPHKAGGGSENQSKSPSMFLTNLYSNPSQTGNIMPLEIQAEEISGIDDSCLPTPSPPLKNCASELIKPETKEERTILDDIYDQETVDIDDYENVDEQCVIETPPLVNGNDDVGNDDVILDDVGNSDVRGDNDKAIEELNKLKDINQYFETPVDEKETQSYESEDVALEKPTDAAVKKEVSSLVLEEVDFSSDEEEADASLNGSKTLTCSQVQLVNKTITSINTPMKDRMKRRRNLKLNSRKPDVDPLSAVEGSVKFAWDSIGAHVACATNNNLTKKGSTEDDLEMAATYDDEFGDMGAGSNLMCNLKMEIAALDATKATLKSKDEKSATNSGKTAPQKRAGRKRNELAFLQSQEIDFQDSRADVGLKQSTDVKADSQNDEIDANVEATTSDSREVKSDTNKRAKRQKNVDPANDDSVKVANDPTAVAGVPMSSSTDSRSTSRSTRARGRNVKGQEKSNKAEETPSTPSEVGPAAANDPGNEEQNQESISKVISGSSRSTRKRAQVDVGDNDGGGKEPQGTVRSKRGKRSQQITSHAVQDYQDEKSVAEETGKVVVEAEAAEDECQNREKTVDETFNVNTTDTVASCAVPVSSEPPVIVTEVVVTPKQEPRQRKNKNKATAVSFATTAATPVALVEENLLSNAVPTQGSRPSRRGTAMKQGAGSVNAGNSSVQVERKDDESAPNHQELSAPSGSDHNVAISGRSSRRGTTKEKSSSRQTRVAEIKQENVDETPHKNEAEDKSGNVSKEVEHVRKGRGRPKREETKTADLPSDEVSLKSSSDPQSGLSELEFEQSLPKEKPTEQKELNEDEENQSSSNKSSARGRKARSTKATETPVTKNTGSQNKQNENGNNGSHGRLTTISGRTPRRVASSSQSEESDANASSRDGHRGRGRGATAGADKEITMATNNVQVKEEMLDQNVVEDLEVESSERSKKKPKQAASTQNESPQKSRSGGKPVYVVFTGIPEPITSKYIKQLASFGSFQIGDDVAKCTCLVTDKIRRTVKFLCALSQGSPIVGVEWVDACIKQQSVVDPEEFLLRDDASESKFGMKLQASLGVAREKGGVFSGLKFFLTQSVVPPPNDLKAIIKSAQGQVLPRMPAAPNSSSPLDESTFIISCEKDAPKVKNDQLKKMTRTVEFILSAIMKQDVDIDSHQLF